MALSESLFVRPASAQQAPDSSQNNVSFWQLIQAQDPYFNKSGSILPQCYTQSSAYTSTSSPTVPHTRRVAANNRVSAQPGYAQTATNTAKARWGYVSEMRFAVLGHDVRFPSRHEFHTPNPFDHRYESGINLNPEVVFTSPEWLKWLGEPRPHVGVSINTSGDTSSVYTGIGWDTAWDNGIFLDGFWGLAAHNGELHDGNSKGKIEFGSRVLFRLGGEIGWRFDDAHGVGLLWEHMSNGGMLSNKNQGIDSLGLRYSYRLDWTS